MQEYDEEVLRTFLRDQRKLFEERVAETIEEAEAFLEDSMAVVVNSLDEVREYFDESGVDIAGLDLMDLEEESEVFKIADGRYLIVEA